MNSRWRCPFRDITRMKSPAFGPGSTEPCEPDRMTSPAFSANAESPRVFASQASAIDWASPAPLHQRRLLIHLAVSLDTMPQVTQIDFARGNGLGRPIQKTADALSAYGCLQSRSSNPGCVNRTISKQGITALRWQARTVSIGYTRTGSDSFFRMKAISPSARG